MEGFVNRWMDAWMNKNKHGNKNGLVDKKKNRWIKNGIEIDGWMDEKIQKKCGWMDRKI